MRKSVAVIGVLAALALSAGMALAQAPGQLPGTLPPAPSVIAPPPPPVAPAPVPSVVTPLPTPSYGVPRNIKSGPVIGGSGGTFRTQYPPRKRHKLKRRHPRTSEILSVVNV